MNLNIVRSNGLSVVMCLFPSFNKSPSSSGLFCNSFILGIIRSVILLTSSPEIFIPYSS